MLASLKMKVIEDLIATSTKEELIWINGYLSGILASPNAKNAIPDAKPGVNKITIAYGTETGSAKKLATNFAAKAKKTGLNVKLVNLEQYRMNDLPKEEYLLTVISTQGEGEPPAGAKKFYDHIHANGFQLNNLHYGVLALGDTSYPLFCKAGEDVDAQLNKLGGQRFVELEKCDTDYEEQASRWFDAAMHKLQTAGTAVAATTAAPKKAAGKKTYTGTVVTNQNLNDRGSQKQTNHVEISAEEVDYQPGDSLGIIPENPLATVQAILSLTGSNGERVIRYKNEEHTLFDLLKKKLNIVYLPDRVVAKYASIVEQDIPATKMGLLDLLKIYSLQEGQFENVISILEPIAPRLYSIASSPEAHNGEVHLTVARDTFTVDGERKYGLCSDFICQFDLNETFPFYIHKNSQFKLPEDDKDIIMVGPGTGIAPFRSFLAQRDATGAAGRNWLFYGDQHFTTDFLYQTELQNWYETGVLTKINTAFSRDQKEKLYVQHRIAEHGAELWDWLQNGSYLYICGAKKMSEDVEDTLRQVAQQQGKMSEEEATDYINQLKDDERLLKDVY